MFKLGYNSNIHKLQHSPTELGRGQLTGTGSAETRDRLSPSPGPTVQQLLNSVSSSSAAHNITYRDGESGETSPAPKTRRKQAPVPTFLDRSRRQFRMSLGLKVKHLVFTVGSD